MPQPLKVTLLRIENEFALCRDEDGHEFYFPTDLLPEPTEGAVVCLKITRADEPNGALEAKTILNAILSEKIA